MRLRTVIRVPIGTVRMAGVEHLAGEQAHAAGHVLPEHVGRL